MRREIGGWIADHPPIPELRAGVAGGPHDADLGDRARGDEGSGPQPKVEFVPELYGADPTQLLTTIRMASVHRSEAADADRP